MNEILKVRNPYTQEVIGEYPVNPLSSVKMKITNAH